MKKTLLQFCSLFVFLFSIMLFTGCKDTSVSSSDQWTLTKINLNGEDGQLLCASFINETTGFVSWNHNKLLTTSDGGTTWYQKPTNFTIVGMQFVNSTTGYVTNTMYGGSISFKTTNAGDNWTSMNTGLTVIRDLKFIDENTGIYVGNGISRTTNSGLNWTKLVDTNVFSIDNMNTSNFAVVGGNNMNIVTVMKSTDQGLNWFFLPNTIINTLVNPSIFYKNNETIFVTGTVSLQNQFRIYKTTDNGNDWNENVTSTGISNFSFYDNLNGLVLKGTGDIYFTINGGESWQDQSIDLGNLQYPYIRMISAKKIVILGDPGYLAILQRN